MSYNIVDFGASTDADLNTAAIQAAIDKAHEGGGGEVQVPPGIWRTGTLWLKSEVTLNVGAGATLKGTNRPEDYPRKDVIAEGIVLSRRVGPRRLVGAVEAENVAVIGGGIIDGDGGCGGQIKDKEGAEGHPQNLQFVKCKGVTVRDLHLRQSGSWMQQYAQCEEVFLHNLKVWNHGNKTTDGVDIDGCRDVRISDCDVDSHDDALVFKSTGPVPCRNIVVNNCRLRSNCHGIKFGTESVGGFENISVNNCNISPSRVPEPLPTRPDGRPVITGCALECTDGGTMKNIHISNITVEKVFAPIFIKLGNRLDRRLEEEAPPEAGMMEDISISNLFAREAGPYSCSISGHPDHPVRSIRLDNIRIECVGGVEADGILEDVPEKSDSYPEINMFTRESGLQLPSFGFYCRHVQGLRLRDIDLRLMSPDAREALVVDDVEGLQVDGFLVDGQELETPS